MSRTTSPPHQRSHARHICQGARKVLPARTTRSKPPTRMALRAELERLQVTLDSIGDGLITVDLHQCITSINRAAQQLTGWQQDDALAKPLNQVFRLVNAHTRQPVAPPVLLA